MDLLKDAAKNLNLYEVKAYVRKAQNVAMNLTEIESKVREATNNEPWGAPSTLMAQIASATYNYREREEIIAFIFRRFTEKAANEWRQVYKSLQLLDYLIKNGSERLIDDVRSNLSLIQMLKSFHYIDSKGRDQGINVRNKAKNLINLLNDDTQIRNERKKARANQKKFGGVSSAAFGGASSIGTSFGSGSSSFNDVDDDEFSNRVYGDGGVYGERYDDPASAYNNGSTGNGGDQFEEYDVQPTTKTAVSKATTGQASRVNAKASKSKPQPKEPQADLIGDLLGLDDAPSQTQTTTTGDDDDDDDDFDDFQAAPSQTQSNSNNLSNNLSSLYHSQPSQQQQQKQQPQFTQFPSQQNIFASSNNTASSSSNFGSASLSTGPAKSSNSNDAFSSLFSSAKTKSSNSNPKTNTVSSTAAAPKPTTQQKQQDDDFFGDFSSSSQSKVSGSKNGNTTNSSNNAGGEVDLLSF
ncbi:ENT3 [Candida pseudojiufengensis]|uniref:ENT3 n=1 Tax=Candida pseudojiufengensis TaxID=497109 RepID=UPI0022243796|nr:ENT3 [Candida pseudojiufengensis]KAI5960195.1 ENT3 [Candida pseudojiufengensis]